MPRTCQGAGSNPMGGKTGKPSAGTLRGRELRMQLKYQVRRARFESQTARNPDRSQCDRQTHARPRISESGTYSADTKERTSHIGPSIKHPSERDISLHAPGAHRTPLEPMK